MLISLWQLYIINVITNRSTITEMPLKKDVKKKKIKLH